MSNSVKVNAAKANKILLGPSNFNEWYRNFKITAIGKDIWNLLNGTEKILNIPNKADYTVTGTSTKIDYDLYKLDLGEYKKQQAKINQAMFTLAKSVNVAIADEIIEMKDPVAAFTHIQSQYKMDDDLALSIALSKMHGLRLDGFSSVAEYLCGVQSAKADIVAAGESFPVAQLRSKILTGLSPAYDRFIENYRLYVTGADKQLSHKGFVSLLLWHEYNNNSGVEIATVNQNSHT